MSKPQISLMLDSGAFSAFSLGKVISLQNYIKFIQDNPECITHAINLDVINPDDANVAAAAGWKNFMEMKDAGLDIIPVFHARESLSWLEKMCDVCSYVGLSGTSLVSDNEVWPYYDLCYQYLCDKNGCPTIDTHLFGDTSPRSLLNYPATSADSSTWMIQAGRAARVNLQGKSYQLRSTKRRDTSYIDNDDTGPKRDAWEAEMTLLGVNPERVMNIHATPSELAMIRAYMVAKQLLNLRDKSANVTRFKKPISLVNTKRQQEGGQERQGPCTVYLVLSPSAYYFNLPIVLLLGVKHVLVSYYYVADAPSKFWPERLTPFLYDPIGFCESHPKVKRYYDKILECLIKEPDHARRNHSAASPDIPNTNDVPALRA